jgi:hypothetical protein
VTLKLGALIASLGLSLGLSAVLADAAAAPDKSMYSLFNPTPAECAPSSRSGRPRFSIRSPSTPAIFFQIESDLFDYVHTNYAGSGTQVFETADPTIKLGLTSSIDFELALNGYLTSATHSNQTGALVADGHGFGDTIVKVKINLVGDDGGVFAMALVPFVTTSVRISGARQQSH